MAAIEVINDKKSTPRIDLTPMVDLNLLLITFFMFATSLSKPKAMQITMPYDEVNVSPQLSKNDATLTVILSNNHKVYYYEGMITETSEIKETDFNSTSGIRDVIIAKNKKVEGLIKSGILKPYDKTTVLIKPDSSSKLQDLIGIIDEMTINAVPVYAIVDIQPEDILLIESHKEASNK